MADSRGLLFVTLDTSHKSSLSSVDIVKWVQEYSRLDATLGDSDAHVYCATDSDGVGLGEPSWLVMWEINDTSDIATRQLPPLGTSGPIIGHRQDLFAVQSTYSAPNFSGNDLRKESATNFIVAVVIMLNETLKAEYDKYYDEEHIDLIKQVPGWRRTRRFIEAPSNGSAASTRSGEVQILQLHDYDPENYGIEGQEFKSATSTTWYVDMMKNAVKSKDRRTYEHCGFVGV